MLTTGELSTVSVGGGIINNYPFVFSKDLKYILCYVSSFIKVYNVKTGELVNILSNPLDPNSHKDEITCIILVPKSEDELYSASLDGTVKHWNYKKKNLIKEYDLGVPIYRMAYFQSRPNDFFITTIKDETTLLLHIWFNGEEISSKIMFHSISACNGLFKSYSKAVQKYFIASFNKTFIVVCLDKIDGPDSCLQVYRHSEKISCIAIDPYNNSVAIGDVIGKITLYNVLSASLVEDPFIGELHWHAHGVTHLEFSYDGINLFSVGEEGVIVKWHTTSFFKNFIPRVGTGIKSITMSYDQSLYGITFIDNSIKIISGVDLQLVQVIHGIQYSSKKPKTLGSNTIFMREPRENYLVLNNGYDSAIQFYNAYTDRHVMLHETATKIKVSRSGEEEIVPHQVDRVAFYSKGSWMATVDSRNDEKTTAEQYLKFWLFDVNLQKYNLHTRIDKPHNGKILSISFRPNVKNDNIHCVTASEDSYLKIWELQELNDNHKDANFVWKLYFSEKRGDIKQEKVVFSIDGSIMAVSCGLLITLRDPFNLYKITKYISPLTGTKIKSFNFVNDSPYLVVITTNFLQVWNIKTLSLFWSKPFIVEKFAVDPKNPQFAIVFMNDKLKHEIRIYDPLILCGDNPIAVYTLHDELVYDIIYLPNVSQEGSYLVYMNQNMELRTIEDSKKSSKHLVESEANLSEEDKKITRSKKRHRSIQ